LRVHEALRIVRLALAEPNSSHELISALAKLLPPRRVRRLLGPWNDRWLELAVVLAEQSLKAEKPPSESQLAALAVLLGIAAPEVSALFAKHRSEKYPDGPHAAALDLIGEVEGMTGRAIRERIAKADAGEGLGFDAVRAALKKP
jgi:hypothetical protein